MANIATYASPAGRVNIIKGKMLSMTEPTEVLSLGCEMQPMPKNKGDNIIYEGIIPTGGSTSNANTINRWSITAASHTVSEGVTPTAETHSYRTVSVTIAQYACLYSYSSKAANFHEDDFPAHQMRLSALRMGLVRELIRYGAMKACTTVIYSGGTSRATVDETVSINNLSLMSRTLLANGAPMKTTILAAGPKYDTSAIEAGYLVFMHSDCEHDVRRLEDFVPVAKYANGSPVNENELGSVGRFRFIISKELNSYPDAGAAVSGLGLKSTTGTLADVFPMIVCGEGSTYDVALNDNFTPFHIPANQRTKDDPHGSRGYVGADFWSAAVVVNNGYMGVIEIAVSSLA